MKKRINSELSGPTASYIASADWSRVPDRGHGVQFYYDDDELMRLLTRFVGRALVTGDVAILLATRAHRTALDRRLAARGLDVNVARTQERYLALDANSILEKILCEGRVDELKARAVIGGLLSRASQTTNADGEPARVFAYGELVAMLVARGAPEEALKLEEIWNGLGRAYAFTLCCGYPMSGFSQRHAAPFMRICAQHSHVFHAAPSVRGLAADRAT